jgi:hypothetical protein
MTEPFAVIIVTVAGAGTASCDEMPLWTIWGVDGALVFLFQNGLFSGGVPK